MVLIHDATRAELAAVRWGPVLGAVLSAALLALLDLAVWPGGPLSLLTWLSVAMLGGAATLALDEPRHDPSRAVPTSRRTRTAARLLLPLLAYVGWLAYAARAVADVRHGGGTASWLALAAGGTAAVTGVAAGAGLLRLAGHAEPGGLVTSFSVALTVGLALVPLPGRVRPYDVTALDGTSVCWTVVSGLGLAALWWATRDAWSTGTT